MKRRLFLPCLFAIAFAVLNSVGFTDIHAQETVVSRDAVHDKIRGGLLAQIIANLNGLRHEFRYKEKPGNVEHYVPDLKDGGRTDDDTDIEWIYIVAMQREGLEIPYEKIPDLWRKHINGYIWSSHKCVRALFELDVPAELTGFPAVNPWASYNLAGQFASETFALVSPGMPQTAARLGVYYLRVAVDAEPLQTTQCFNTMIATAFLTDDLERIVQAGHAAVDPESSFYDMIVNVRRWCRENPDDWRKTRQLIHDTYTRYGNTFRDHNGYELNGCATLAAILYGKGDFVETCRHAFNFGWDADNVAATSATILGVMKGRNWFHAQGWTIKDIYANTTRDEMPMDETITSFGDRLVELAEKNIVRHGGTILGEKIRFPVEKPANVLSVKTLARQRADFSRKTETEIMERFGNETDERKRMRDVYLAVCLGFDGTLKEKYPEPWKKGVEALTAQKTLLQLVYHEAVKPVVEEFRNKFDAAGFRAPPREKKTK